MRVYVASKYQNKDLVRKHVLKLKEAGFEITSTWHREPYAPNVQLDEISDAKLRRIAKRDIVELEAADAILVLSHDCLVGRGGMWWEFGYAYAQNKRTILIGEKVVIFAHLPTVENYPTLNEFLETEKVCV